MSRLGLAVVTYGATSLVKGLRCLPIGGTTPCKPSSYRTVATNKNSSSITYINSFLLLLTCTGNGVMTCYLCRQVGDPVLIVD